MKSKSLVIVESPAKAKTIGQFLGNDFVVRASYGHVRDLPKSKLGVDVDDKFKPQYLVGTKSKKIISELKKLLAESKDIFLATDQDREGEAIAWHVVEVLKPKQTVKRITFHEITKKAIEHAISNPREISLDLVDAQQARRVLDRLVGYKLSPFLWKKVYRGLSAGRVQSVAVRLIVEREEEVNKFETKQYFTIEGIADVKKGQLPIVLIEKGSTSQYEIKDQKEADKIEKELKTSDVKVTEITKNNSEVRAPYPLITSTLQQQAARFLSFSAKKTMMVAQGLYEGVDIPGMGTVALITYMRTDSHEISTSAQQEINATIEKSYGKNYLPKTPNTTAKKVKGAQEAHEAIHPVDFSINPESIKDKVSRDQYRLYNMIWRQTVASQMAPAEVETTIVNLETNKGRYLLSKGQKLVFDGHLKLSMEEDRYTEIPEVTKDESAKIKKIETIEHWTQPPARYSDASLIKELEKRGIGRPSTYASILSTIVERGYTVKKAGRYYPEAIAEIVINLLKENFTEIVDYEFTAKMEEDLDDIAEGDKKYLQVMTDFYGPFAKNLAEKEISVTRADIVDQGDTDKDCPKCGKKLSKQINRFGLFYKCKDEECGYTAPVLEGILSEEQILQVDKEISEPCPECKGKLQIKSGRFGPFISCEKYPDCKYTKAISVKAEVKCPDCGSDILKRKTRRGRDFWGCSGYPKCKKAFWDEPVDKECPDCKSLLVKKRTGLACSSCQYKEEHA